MILLESFMLSYRICAYFCGFLVALSLLFSSQVVTSASAQEAFSLGIYHLSQEEYEQAIFYLNKSLELYPDNEQAYLALAEAYQKTNRPEKAEDALNQALAINPKDAKVYLSLGVIYFERGEYKRAASQFEEALKLISPNPEVSNLLSLCYYNAGVEAYRADNKDAAISDFKKALKINPENIKAAQNLAVILFNKGKSEQAKEVIDKGLKVEPGDKNLLLLKAKICQKEKDWKGLLETLEILERYYPDDVDIGLNLAYLYRYQNKVPKAIALYSKLKAKYPEEKRIYEALASQYEATRKYEDARKVYREALSHLPDDFEIYDKIADIYRKEKHYDDARKEYEKFLELKSDYVPAYQKISELYEEEGNLEAATGEIRKALEAATEKWELYKELGRLYEKFDSGKAISTYEEMIRINKSDPYSYIRLGKLYEAKAVPKLAEESFKQATELESDNPLPYYKMALFWADKGDTNNTVFYTKEAINKGLDKLAEVTGKVFGEFQGKEERLNLSDLEKLSEIAELAEEPEQILRDALDFLLSIEQDETLETDLKLFLDDHPEDPILLEYLGLLYEREENWDKVITTYEWLLKKKTKVKTAHLGMARAYEKQGRDQEAILAYKRVLELDEEEEKAYAGLIRLYGKKGKLGQLIDEWKLKAKLQHKNVMLLQQLAKLFKEKGREEEAQGIEAQISEIKATSQKK